MNEPNRSERAPVLLLGGGGHALVLWEVLAMGKREVCGFVDPAPPEQLALFRHGRWLGGDAAVLGFEAAAVELVNGVGSVDSTAVRRNVFERFAGRGYRFAGLTHPGALVSRLDVALGQGVQILAGAVVGPAAKLGDNVLVNSRAVVEHDCVVGDHCHIASGAVLCGGVRLGRGVHVGAGATVIQGVVVGDGAIIAAGAAVIEDVPPATLVAGVPARSKRTIEL
ncbi:acetyltransferase [Methylogaea oryzae]|uniref:Pilus assembly protein n=1 Tax=Methylogaea oryzae TaxID=1295382 RepID=A0A8D5AJ03_9GAMM|nr:acetyltransferase [Methylogaea oryzae]BBL70274.1 pilus assembly protein [Methylogaea oryzae]